jgi:hypothetical protein
MSAVAAAVGLQPILSFPSTQDHRVFQVRRWWT